MSRFSARWRARARTVAGQWTAWKGQWEVERHLERALEGDGPIIAGPWCSEVGYEVLYWIPFLRWVMAAYRIPENRLIALSRGGTASWYRGVAGRYVEIFDHIPPSEYGARAAAGHIKQRETSAFDTGVVRRVSEALALPASTAVLHPSLMFRWFAPFWSGHETLGFVERHTRYASIVSPQVDIPIALPAEYAAVKLYRARSLPDEPAVRAQLRTLVDALSDRMPVVHLDTGLGLDDHADYALDSRGRRLSVNGLLEPRTNLAVQTRIAAGARVFVGTCGSLAWLTPLLGIPTIPVFTDASFLHAHLHLARRVYGRVGAAPFSPVDLSGVIHAGLAWAAPHAAVASSRES